MSNDDISPTSLKMLTRARAFRRTLDTLPRPRTGRGSAMAVAFIASGWFYGAVVAGTAPGLLSGAASSVGLKATDILITGQVETTEQQIFDALAVGPSGSLFGFDAAKARGRLMEFPWVKDVAIRKLYPGKLTVAVAEKRAAAVWQYQDRLIVVDRAGDEIDKFGIADLLNDRFSHLPHLIGEGAPENASEILPRVGRYPQLAGSVSSYVRVANRRWDLNLSNGIRVQLPEYDLEDQLEYLSELASEQRLLEREVFRVDLRIADRVVLRMLPEAAKVRSELVAARLKAMKKADRKL